MAFVPVSVLQYWFRSCLDETQRKAILDTARSPRRPHPKSQSRWIQDGSTRHVEKCGPLCLNNHNLYRIISTPMGSTFSPLFPKVPTSTQFALTVMLNLQCRDSYNFETLNPKARHYSGGCEQSAHSHSSLIINQNGVRELSIPYY